MNGQTALEAAYNTGDNKKTFSFMLQYYGDGLGYLVDMINGTFDTALSTESPYYFWDFIVNGKNSDTGIDQTKIKDGAKITFTFKPYIPEASTSNLKAKFAAKSGK